ncbi:MAG TPA: bacterial transcriptional activator domain-containing protein [Dermatophilaceae bacterium]
MGDHTDMGDDTDGASPLAPAPALNPDLGLGQGLGLGLLGHWRLSADGLPMKGLGENARRLLAILALRGGISRSVLGGTLWPEATEGTAAARLRTVLWRLAGSRSALLEEKMGSIQLSSRVVVDVDELFVAASRVEAGLPDTDLRLFQADLLPGWDEDWLVVYRERIRQARMHALERLSVALLEQGRYAMALDAALSALLADQLRESAHRAVISVHLAEGNVVEAIHQFDRCCRLLKEELGVAPSQVLRGMIRTAATIIGRDDGAGGPLAVLGEPRQTSATPPRATPTLRAAAAFLSPDGPGTDVT